MSDSGVKSKKILLTGAAGFIGYKTAEGLLKDGHIVCGIDNLNDYYDVRLKKWRLKQLKEYQNFTFSKIDIEDYDSLKRYFTTQKNFDAVINLAARAGVRYSMENPFVYMRTNAQGTLNLLELMHKFDIRKMVLASTSSLYAGQKMPFREDLPVNTPISPYAASKKAAESIAYTYHYLYKMDIIILRYFTVYGPAGRPDMSIFRFIKWIDEGEGLIIYGDGTQSRDFTYVDDIADGTIRALNLSGFEIINLGNNQPHRLREIIKLIEKKIDKKAKIIKRPFFSADLKATWADIKKAKHLMNWRPMVSINEGIERTVAWYEKNKQWVRNIEIDMKK